MEMTWSVLIIFFCSFVCQTVFIFFGTTTFKKLGGTADKHSQIQTISRCINWTQYAVDPFIYAIRNKEFREAYKDVFYPVTYFVSKIRGITLTSRVTTTQQTA